MVFPGNRKCPPCVAHEKMKIHKVTEEARIERVKRKIDGLAKNVRMEKDARLERERK
jgi:hypothetical protein